MGNPTPAGYPEARDGHHPAVGGDDTARRHTFLAFIDELVGVIPVDIHHRHRQFAGQEFQIVARQVSRSQHRVHRRQTLRKALPVDEGMHIICDQEQAAQRAGDRERQIGHLAVGAKLSAQTTLRGRLESSGTPAAFGEK
ncbi:hypothetical protein ACFSC4_15180 [Deinococcus malanensis]|uniref:hypothetical protein n=1 Tax=Deinococcus malanensis TaxID=1706855 RepID=UPI0036360086